LDALPIDLIFLTAQPTGHLPGNQIPDAPDTRSAHNGNNSPNEEAILPFFSTPQEGADYVEFIEAKKAAGF
jgi:hypothetical protein